MGHSLLTPFISLLFLGIAGPVMSSNGISDETECAVFEDFEAYRPGDRPYRWKRNKGRRLIPANQKTMDPETHTAIIQQESGNRFVRMEMSNYAYRLIKLNGKQFNWNADRCPVLSWRWRIMEFPEGGNERQSGTNDVAAAVYVTFGRDWLGRPISIKYTWSSTLPKGTVVDYGPLQVLVVGTARRDPLGEWVTVKRDVVADYKRLFGERPETWRPLALTLFSDADDVPGATAVVDFDDVRVLGSL